jgi:hypothetical protein
VTCHLLWTLKPRVIITDPLPFMILTGIGEQVCPEEQYKLFSVAVPDTSPGILISNSTNASQFIPLDATSRTHTLIVLTRTLETVISSLLLYIFAIFITL